VAPLSRLIEENNLLMESSNSIIAHISHKTFLNTLLHPTALIDFFIKKIDRWDLTQFPPWSQSKCFKSFRTKYLPPLLPCAYCPTC